MHGMSIHLFRLNRLKGGGAHMQSHFLTFYLLIVDALQHRGREMQSCRRCRHRTLDTRINRLIRALVALLRLAIQIWRNRNLTGLLQQIAKRNLSGRPRKTNTLRLIFHAYMLGRKNNILSVQRQLTMEFSAFPFLQIAHQTKPFARALCLKILRIIGWHQRF